MEACSLKRVAGTCIELCLHLSGITFRCDILFPMQKQCCVVPSTITKSVEIQRAHTNTVNSRLSGLVGKYTTGCSRMIETPVNPQK
jgi:hypothetical protein